VILLDTTVLVYAMGRDHDYREPCRELIEAVARGAVSATTTVEAIQEFVHVRARRRDRAEAAGLGRDYASLLAPLLSPGERDLEDGLALFERSPALGAFDAVLAAAGVNAGVAALVSADPAFAAVPGLVHVLPDRAAIAALIEA
jgi:predicted nucleic acid-binding protein